MVEGGIEMNRRIFFRPDRTRVVEWIISIYIAIIFLVISASLFN